MVIDKKKMWLIGTFVLFFIIIFLGVLLYSNLIDYMSLLDKKVIYTRVIVGDSYGIDLNNSAMIFGMVPPGASSNRDFEIKNTKNQLVRAKIYIKGKIAPYLIISENNFILKPYQSKNVTFTVSPPEGLAQGTYDGQITILIKNAIVK